MAHTHVELIRPLDELDEARLQVAVESFFPRAEWQLGGRFRGAHEPGGPFPERDVQQEEVGGLILRYTSGRTGLGKLDLFALARPLDLIWLDSAEGKQFIDEGIKPARWLSFAGDEPGELDRRKVIELANESQAETRLALATLDVHE